MDLRPKELLSPANLGLLVLAVVALALSFLALTRTSATPPAAAPVAPPASPSPSPMPRQVAVVGDEAVVASGEGPSFVDLLAQERGWVLQTFGAASSGFVAPGEQGAYDAQLDPVVAADPDVVVLQGSPNDVGQEGLTEAATGLIERVRAALPQTRIVLMSAVAAPSQELQDVNDLLRQVALINRVHFVDAAEAFAGAPPPVGPDGELSAGAHAALAAALVDDFELLKI